MKTKLTSDFELLRLERFRSRRRERRGWKRRLGCWLWLIVVVLMLALWVTAARAEEGNFAPQSLEGRGEEIWLAGVPDWVAFGVVMTLIFAVMGRLAWSWCVEADARSTYEDETWGQPIKADEGTLSLDAAMAVHACASRVGLIRSIVQGAQRPSTEEDQAEALATAERMLGDLRVTLWELRAEFRGKNPPRRLEGRGEEEVGA